MVVPPHQEVSMTEPSLCPPDDHPCHDCGRGYDRSRLDDEGRCDECATPAGRLLTELLARGIKAETSDDTDGVIVGGLFVDAVDCGWGISSQDEASDLDGNVRAAADAIAAIANHDALAAEVKRLREDLRMEGLRAGGWHSQTIDMGRRVERLTAELEKPVVGAWVAVDGGHARYAGGVMIAIVTTSWMASRPPWHGDAVDGGICGRGPETGDAGRHAADLALTAAGYRLVGGVYPLLGEVPDAR
jgi:hypothetical protein